MILVVAGILAGLASQGITLLGANRPPSRNRTSAYTFAFSNGILPRIGVSQKKKNVSALT